MNQDDTSITVSTGRLYFQTKKAFELERKDIPIEELLSPTPSDLMPSYVTKGWYDIIRAIRKGELITIEAKRFDIKVEAQFNSVTNIPDGYNGKYEIKGGPHSGKGIFINVAPKEPTDVFFTARDNAQFTHFFVCYSHGSINNLPFLRWRIVLREFSSLDMSAT